MRHGRTYRSWGGVVVALAGLLVSACETTRTTGQFQRDLTPPVLSITTTADTQDISGGLNFTVSASDNISLKDIRLVFTGGYNAIVDSVFAASTPSVVQNYTIKFPKNSGAGGNIIIAGRATDGAGNFTDDTLRIFLVNVQALQVTLAAPSAGAVASPGRYVPITVIAVQASGVKKVGWLVAPANQVAKAADSIITAAVAPYPDSVTFVDSVLVTGNSGTFTVVGFAVDSGGRLATSSQITVSIQSAANDVTPPEVSHSVPIRAEVQDTVTVHATDPSGILIVGFTVRDTAGVLIKTDSVIYSGTSTDIVHAFPMNLPDSVFPQLRVVQGFAYDNAAAKNRGVSGATFTSPSPPGAPRADTITVVAGITRALPTAGSQIMDAAVDSARNEVYMTNISQSRLEVFDLGTTQFVASVPTGSLPWGIALWPHDTLGHYGDTVVVANSGGTNLSIIDVAARKEVRRQRLPNFIVQKVKTEVVNGAIHLHIETFDWSDRPQYLGVTCRHQASGVCDADSIIAVYSTTPTPDQSGFPDRGTLRWDNLTSPTPDSHFFFEHATAAANPEATDTAQIIVDRPWYLPKQTDTILCSMTGVIVDFNLLPFAETTFVRNSGDFTHAFMGEGATGGRFARVLNYAASGGRIYRTDTDSVGGVTISCNTQYDLGISPAIRVSDFISNTATNVEGVAVNFNGHTNVVRTGDSIYALDAGLRLGGTFGGTGANPGMDFHPNNDFDPFVCGTAYCGGSDNPNARLFFSARPDGGIDVFDSYFFGRVTTIPIKSPVIGPLRVAKGGTQIILVGVTAAGVVTVRVPNITNIFPTRFKGVAAKH